MSSYDKFWIAVLAAKNCRTSQSYIYLSYLCLIMKTDDLKQMCDKQEKKY